jgi:hypothetical protein
LVYLSVLLFQIYIYYFLVILFSSILCTCPNQHNLFNLLIHVIVGFLTIAQISLLVNILQFSFSLVYHDQGRIYARTKGAQAQGGKLPGAAY